MEMGVEDLLPSSLPIGDEQVDAFAADGTVTAKAARESAGDREEALGCRIGNIVGEDDVLVGMTNRWPGVTGRMSRNGRRSRLA